jgi:hypothetical protein
MRRLVVSANPLHNLVRAGIKRSALFREAALRLGDFFYGRLPIPAPDLLWLNPAGDEGSDAGA